MAALLLPLAASGGGKTGSKPRAAKALIDAVKRDIFATDDRGNLLRFRAAIPQLVTSKPITGLPAGVSSRSPGRPGEAREAGRRPSRLR
jgi:hypothetical protein